MDRGRNRHDRFENRIWGDTGPQYEGSCMHQTPARFSGQWQKQYYDGRFVYVCPHCKHIFQEQTSICPQCGTWNSMTG